MHHRIIDTPTGRFALVVDDAGGLRTTWLDAPEDEGLPAGCTHDPNLLEELAVRLRSYFAGGAVDFEDVELPAGTRFQRECWAACRHIPRGETRTYAQLAELAGSPGAARAAGQAMRHNPLPVIIPCHRVIAGHGRLGGFSGSTDRAGRPLERKRLLLTLEGAIEPDLLSIAGRERPVDGR